MGIKDKLGGLSATFDLDTPPKVSFENRAKSAPVRLVEFSKEFKDQERQLLEMEAAKGKPIEVSLDLLDDSPFQVRPIDLDAVKELAENLRENPLTTPIVCRKLEGGRYEIIAGHHRKQAFQVLGRQSIPVVVVDYSEEDTERALVFDNLVRSEMPDFYRYKSLSQLRDRHGWTGTEIADRTGISKTEVYNLMSFERLPPAVLEIVQSHPESFSSWLVAKMVSSKARVNELTELCKRLAAQQISPQAAAASLKSSNAPTPKRPPSQEAQTQVTLGKSVVEIRARPDRFTVKLPSGLVQQDKADTFNTRLAELVKEIFG